MLRPVRRNVRPHVIGPDRHEPAGGPRRRAPGRRLPHNCGRVLGHLSIVKEGAPLVRRLIVRSPGQEVRILDIGGQVVSRLADLHEALGVRGARPRIHLVALRNLHHRIDSARLPRVHHLNGLHPDAKDKYGRAWRRARGQCGAAAETGGDHHRHECLEGHWTALREIGASYPIRTETWRNAGAQFPPSGPAVGTYRRKTACALYPRRPRPANVAASCRRPYKRRCASLRGEAIFR